MPRANVRPSVASIVRAMRSTPLLENVAADRVKELAEEVKVRRFGRGTYLFHQGDDAPTVFFLLDGRVEINSLSSTGHRQLHTTLEPHAFFGELGVLGRMPRTATALAVEEATVCILPGDTFLRFLASNSAAALELLEALSRQVQAQEALVEDLLFLDLRGRVAKRLLGLVSPSFDEPPDDGAILPSIVTHSDIASLAGGSRENVSRILSEFQRRGVIARNGRRYVLKDISRLRRFAGL
ncbi:MAG: Crp/Fnr family transcriptional regulator [Actinomycetota bacterium]